MPQQGQDVAVFFCFCISASAHADACCKSCLSDAISDGVKISGGAEVGGFGLGESVELIVKFLFPVGVEGVAVFGVQRGEGLRGGRE